MQQRIERGHSRGHEHQAPGSCKEQANLDHQTRGGFYVCDQIFLPEFRCVQPKGIPSGTQQKAQRHDHDAGAPEPVRNKDLTAALAAALGKPAFMPSVPGFAVKLALGEFGSVLLKGQKVLPVRLKEMGFSFLFPDIRKALRDLVAKGAGEITFRPCRS